MESDKWSGGFGEWSRKLERERHEAAKKTWQIENKPINNFFRYYSKINKNSIVIFYYFLDFFRYDEVIIIKKSTTNYQMQKKKLNNDKKKNHLSLFSRNKPKRCFDYKLFGLFSCWVFSHKTWVDYLFVSIKKLKIYFFIKDKN